MTTTHTNLALVEGEVYILHGTSEKGWYTELFELPVLASTRCLSSISQLDRKHFVKPKVDVEELASTYAEREKRIVWELEGIVFDAFKAGYNAKEAEFTRKDMEKAFLAGNRAARNLMDSGAVLNDCNAFINGLHQLSLPKSVTVNENNEVTHVEW